MTRLEQVEKILVNNRSFPGITASQLARKTGMKRKSAMNRVSDLRVAGVKITSNRSKRNKTYYLLAA